MALDYEDMSDEDLEAAFNAAKAELDSPEISTEEVQEDSDNLVEQDSDLNGSEVDGGDEAEVASEGADEVLDGDAEAADEQTTEAEAKVDTALQPAQKYRYRANGKDYEFSEDEIKQQFPKVFAQAMDYTKKMQAIKPWRKTIDAIEQSKLSHDDVSLMIDVLKGDKAAIATVLKRTGVDTLELDIDSDSKYVPKSYGRDESVLAIKDIVDEISQDQEYAVTSRIIDKEWDEGSWKEISSNPILIKQLHIDVKNGDFAKVQPIAEKMKLYNPGQGTDLDYYKAAARVYYGELAQQKQYEQQVQAQQQNKQVQVQQERKVAEVRQKEIQRTTTTQAAAKRKAAAPTKTGGGKPQGVIDYLDASEEDFNNWYKTNVEGR